MSLKEWACRDAGIGMQLLGTSFACARARPFQEGGSHTLPLVVWINEEHVNVAVQRHVNESHDLTGNFGNLRVDAFSRIVPLLKTAVDVSPGIDLLLRIITSRSDPYGSRKHIKCSSGV